MTVAGQPLPFGMGLHSNIFHCCLADRSNLLNSEEF